MFRGLFELRSAGFNCKVIGNGDKVISQLPGAYQSVPKGGIVVLYTEGGPVETKTKVPDLTGLSITQVNRTAAATGINVKISGNTLVNSSSLLTDRASQRAKASITARRSQYTSNRIPAFPILRADKGDF